MIFNEVIGSWECIATLGCISIIPVMLATPAVSANDFGTASFLHSIYAAITAGLFLFIIFNLYSKFKNKDILDVSEFAGGKLTKYLTGFLAIFYLMLSSVVTLSEFNENIRNILFPHAPAAYISSLFVLAIFVGTFVGLKGIIRTSSLIAPVIITGFIAMFISLLGKIDLTNFTPILGNGAKTFFIDGAFRIGRYESFLLILLLGPNIKNLGKTATKSFFMVTFIILISLFLIFGIIPYPSVTENYFALFEVSRLVSYGRFIQRVESIFILVWLVATFIYLSLGVTLIVHIMKKLFNITYYRRLIPSVTILLLSASLLLSSYVDIVNYRRILSVYIAPILIFLYPFIVLLIATIKQKKKIKD